MFSSSATTADRCDHCGVSPCKCGSPLPIVRVGAKTPVLKGRRSRRTVTPTPAREPPVFSARTARFVAQRLLEFSVDFGADLPGTASDRTVAEVSGLRAAMIDVSEEISAMQLSGRYREIIAARGILEAEGAEPSEVFDFVEEVVGRQFREGLRAYNLRSATRAVRSAQVMMSRLVARYLALFHHNTATFFAEDAALYTRIKEGLYSIDDDLVNLRYTGPRTELARDIVDLEERVAAGEVRIRYEKTVSRRRLYDPEPDYTYWTAEAPLREILHYVRNRYNTYWGVVV